MTKRQPKGCLAPFRFATPALLVGVVALALALAGLTFPGVIAGALAAWLGGMAWSEANKDVALIALGCAGAALAIGFVELVQTAYG